MKRLTTLLFLIAWSTSLALNGSRQVHVEELYDTYRLKYLSPLTESKQVETLTKIQTALSQYRQRPGTSTGVKDMVSYLEHLFCHTKSLLTGYYCEDNYRPSSQLTTSKNNFSISELRQLLIQEHSKRRIERGLGALTESATLDSIAQTYAERLCAAGEITHTLNGSTLEQRFSDGGYNYIWGGENLGLGQENIMELLDQLTTSIHHRENMYQPEFEEIGLGQCESIWVINYGSR